MARSLRTTLAWLPVALVMLWGCRKAPIPTGPSLAPAHNIHLRTSFDTDPSDHLGRFLPDGLVELDESSGMALACSEHISWRFIDGGGVQTTEVLHTSSSTRARLGAAGMVEASTGAEQTRAVRVSYTLTGKMVSTIADPAAFAACCKAQPDQCTSRMVGEFLQGTGTVDVELARGRDAQLKAVSPAANLSGGMTVDADVTVANGVAWRRSVVFPEPVYFAFKATETPYDQRAVRTCSDWADALPESPDGLYLRATSGPAWSEQLARKRARAVLSEQALAVAGLAEVSGATAPGIHEQDWCIERFEEDGVTQYAAHVLGFMSHADRDAARVGPPPVEEAVAAPVAKPSAPPAVVPPCADWVETLPTSDDGLFVVGRHVLPSVTKQGARLKALANAHIQAGLATGLAATALANGTTIGVQEREWCVVPSQVGGQSLYRAHLLGFVSEQEQDRLRALPQPTVPQ